MTIRQLISAVYAIMVFGLFLQPGGLRAQSLAQALQYLEASTYHIGEIGYPYVASEERKAQILKGMNSLKRGMSLENVRDIMGPPDEIDAVFHMAERSQEIHSFQYIYLLTKEKLDEWGTQFTHESVTVNFNMAGSIMSVYGRGVPDLAEIPQEQGLGFRFEMGIGESVAVEELGINLEKIDIEQIDGANGTPDHPPGEGSVVTFIAKLPDRAEKIRVSILTEPYKSENIGYIGKYKLTLLAVPERHRVLMKVE